MKTPKKEIVNLRFDWLKSVVDKSGHARIDELRDLTLQALQALKVDGKLHFTENERLREEIKKALDYMVDQGSYTTTREGRISLRDGYLADLSKPTGGTE